MTEPGRDCSLCPRLADFRSANRLAHPGWHNGAVSSFGELTAPILVVGLAPGLKGANRTGRPFTGDFAGDLLYATLLKLGLAEGVYGRDPSDGFRVNSCRITNAVRCVPPGNKPSPAEFKACRPFLEAELAAMPHCRGILCLGRESHDQVLSTLGLRKAQYPFGHGHLHSLPGGKVLADSYHCSRLNTNTGRLTAAMFESVVAALAGAISGG